MGGSKHLIDKIIDNMQNHFREAILKNSGNLEAIRQDVWAVLKHMVRNDTEILEHEMTLKSLSNNMIIAQIIFHQPLV